MALLCAEMRHIDEGCWVGRDQAQDLAWTRGGQCFAQAQNGQGA